MKYGIGSLGVLFAMLLSAGQVSAFTYVVTTAQDDDRVIPPGTFTLRQAIEAANTNTAVGNAPAGSEPGNGLDIIRIDIDEDPISPNTIQLTNGALPTITEQLRIEVADDDDDPTTPVTPVTINAPNANLGGDIVLSVTSPAGQLVELSSLRLQNGVSATNGGCLQIAAGSEVIGVDLGFSNCTANGAAADNGGGAIYNEGSLTLSEETDGRLVFDGNMAAVLQGSGGAIFNTSSGVLDISGATFSDNQAKRAGGAIENTGGTITIDGSTFVGNGFLEDPAPGNGGAIHSSGTGSVVTIEDSSFIENDAAKEGGALWNNNGGVMNVTSSLLFDNGAAQEGGGIWNGSTGTMTLIGSETRAAPAMNGPSLPLVSDMLIDNNFAEGDANTEFGGGGVFNLGTMTLTRVDITRNQAVGTQGNGGGIMVIDRDAEDDFTPSLTVTDAIFFENEAVRAGGGLENQGGTISLTNVSFDTNSADSIVIDPNADPVLVQAANPGNGGAVHNASGSLTITDGEVINNVAAKEGGGLWNGSAGSITILTDSTPTNIEGNVAQGAESTLVGGGGIFNLGTMTVADATIVNNSATGLPAALDGTGGGNGGGIMVLDTDTEDSFVPSMTLTGTQINTNSARRAGGAIENQGGTLVLVDVDMDGNQAQITAGANPGASPGNGGAIHNFSGSISIQNGSITGNVAPLEGGGIWNGTAGTLTITATTGEGAGTLIDGNTASGGADNTALDQGGGGVFNLGIATIDGAAISNNVADGDFGNGGGVMNADDNTNDELDEFEPSLTITNSTISDNTANRAGGGAENQGGGTLTLTDVNMDRNKAIGGGVMGSPGNGGAVHSAGSTLVVAGSTGDATAVVISGNTAASEGGGIWASGTATISNLTLSMNDATGASATEGGGGLFNIGGDMNVSNVVITMNTAMGAAGDATSGGGVLSDGGTLTIANSTISNNSTLRAGGGIEITEGTVLDLDNVTLSGNTAGGIIDAPDSLIAGNGGALHVSDSDASALPTTVTIDDSMITGNSGVTEGGGLWNALGATMTVSNSTVSDNDLSGSGDAAKEAHDGGGGIFNAGGVLVLSGVTVTGNEALGGQRSGGGLLNLSGDVTITGSTISSNLTSRAGGGIEDNSNGGGGIDAARTSLVVTNTQMSSNQTQGDTNVAGSPGNGGAVHLTGNGVFVFDRSSAVSNSAANEGGGLWNFATGDMTIVNSTLSGNTSPSGGGLFVQPSSATGITRILSSTIANNSAPTNAGIGGGILVDTNGIVLITNSIVADNTAATGPDVNGEVLANSSLIADQAETTFAAGGDQQTIMEDPDLLALALNGGSTLNHALNDGSPALDAGDNTSCANAPVNNVDQRGFTRPFNATGTSTATCDIGSFESLDNIEITIISTNDGGNASGGGTATVATGAQDVAANGFTINNPSGGAITLAGFSGTLNGNGDFSQVTDFQVFLDTDNDGDGDTEITTATVTPNVGAGTYTVTFSPAQTVAANASASYVLTVDFGANANQQAALWLLLPFALLVGFMRRSKMALLAASGLLLLTACGGGGGGGGGGVPSAGDGGITTPPPSTATYRLDISAIDATDSASRPVVTSSLPLTGVSITVQ